MESIKKFNGLNGTIATRSQIEKIIDLAKKENQVDVIYRLSKIINAFPNKKEFEIEITEYPKTGLNAPRHKGLYKEALDDCGRLLPGFAFDGGSVIAVKSYTPKQLLKKYNKRKAKACIPCKPKTAPKENEKKTAISDTKQIEQKKPVQKVAKYSKTAFYFEDYMNWRAEKFPKEKRKWRKLEDGLYEYDSFLSFSYHPLNNNANFKLITKKGDKYIYRDILPTQPKPAPKVAKTPKKASNYGKRKTITRTEKVVKNLDFYKKYNIPEDEFLSFYKSKTGANGFYKIYELNQEINFADFYKDYLLHLYENKLKGAFYFTDKKTNVMIESDLISKKISLPKVETDKFLALKNIVSKDAYRPILNGVLIEKDSLVATDAHKLVVLHTKNNENVGKIKDFLTEKDYTNYLKIDGREQLTKVEYFKKHQFYDGKYPNYKDIIPKYKNFSKLEDIEKWLQICKNYIEVAGKNLVQIIFKEYHNEIGFNPKIMYDALEALAKGGNKKVKFAFSEAKKAILIHTETKDYALIMPVFKDDEYLNTVFSSPFEMKNAYNMSGLQGFYGTTLFDIKQNNVKKNTPKRKPTKPLNGFVDNVLANVVASAALGAPSANLAQKIAQKDKKNASFYKISGPEIADFLGQIEIKNKESVAITIAGGQGSGKTRFCFQIMNAFAKHYKVGHASIEEQPDSELYYKKVIQYIDQSNLKNIEAPEINNIKDVHELIARNDVIVIDSFSKLQEMQRGTELDKDFRKKYNAKLFIIIYQLTTDGKMRGGAKSQFDGDIICDVVKNKDFQNNYIVANKNRYQNQNIEDLKFNIYHQKLIKTPGPQAQENKNFKFNINVN